MYRIFKCFVVVLLIIIKILLTDSSFLTSLTSFFTISTETSKIFGYEDIQSIKKAHMTEERERHNNYPTILNLREYLHIISFRDTSPLIILDNFQNINLDKTDIPIIIRNPVPVVHQQKYGDKTYLSITLAASMISLKNLSLSVKVPEVPCPASKFLIPFGSNKRWDICLRVNHTRFAPHIKSFTYTIHIGYFPPAYIPEYQKRWIYPIIFMDEMCLTKHCFSTVSFRFPINVMVLLQNQQRSKYIQFPTILRWTTETRPVTRSLYTHNTFLIFIAEKVETNSSNGLSILDLFGNIEAAYVLQLCPSCAPEWGKSFGSVHLIKIESLEYLTLSKLAFSMINENIVWAPQDNYQNNLVATVMKFCQKCGAARLIWKSLEPCNSSILEKVALAHADIILSFMRNSTIVNSRRNQECTHEEGDFNFVVYVTPHPYSSSHFTYPYYLKDHLSKLRIVGCGRKGIETLPFHEFINVYDKYVWFGIFASLLIFSAAMGLLFKKEGLSKFIMTPVLKILLEQSNPFPPSTTNLSRSRILSGLALLMGIILSSAYKNTNVYNMVVPRKHVLYKYFNELVSAKFDMYTRSMYVNVAPTEMIANFMP